MPALQMSGVSKSFPGVRALDDVSLEVEAGEIVGLVGVNGAGKSTLMNILGGILRPDSGEIRIGGHAVALHNATEATKQGIAFIHQELLFFASQTVAENIFIAHQFMRKAFPFFVDKRKANREAKRYLQMLGLEISPKARMEDLSVGERQVVEIARALVMGSHIVILDEPTSSLSLKEKKTLFGIVRKLRAEGKAIIYISHFLDEIFELCDKFVVMRNGQVHGRGLVRDVIKDDLVRMIIGRELAVETKHKRSIAAKPVLRLESIRSGRLVRDVSFELHKGEILGIWGLMGSGRTELLRALFGLDRISQGKIFFGEDGELSPIAPKQLLDHCGYITESRHTDGLFLSQPVWTNITAAALDRYASPVLRVMNVRGEIRTATDYIGSLRVAGQGHSAVVSTLSGGNQQKVVFAKWLNRKPRILVMDEPTRGVDVGAKLEIANLVRDLAQSGTSVILVTSEVEEMVNLSDRVLVLREGRIVASETGENINSAALMRLALTEEKHHDG